MILDEGGVRVEVEDCTGPIVGGDGVGAVDGGDFEDGLAGQEGYMEEEVGGEVEERVRTGEWEGNRRTALSSGRGTPGLILRSGGGAGLGGDWAKAKVKPTARPPV